MSKKESLKKFVTLPIYSNLYRLFVDVYPLSLKESEELSAVHKEDGGSIERVRICKKCKKEVPIEEIVYLHPDFPGIPVPYRELHNTRKGIEIIKVKKNLESKVFEYVTQNSYLLLPARMKEKKKESENIHRYIELWEMTNEKNEILLVKVVLKDSYPVHNGVIEPIEYKTNRWFRLDVVAPTINLDKVPKIKRGRGRPPAKIKKETRELLTTLEQVPYELENLEAERIRKIFEEAKVERK